MHTITRPTVTISEGDRHIEGAPGVYVGDGGDRGDVIPTIACSTTREWVQSTSASTVDG